MADNTMEYNPNSGKLTMDAERDMVEAAKDDADAFGMLYDRYYSEIFRYIYRRTFDHTLAEDLTSNTFFAALRNIRRYKWRCISFSAWLYRIATNEIGMHYRKQNPLVGMDSDMSDTSEPDDLSSEEEYAILHRAILKLKPVYQTVITLRFFEDKTIDEICQITGKKEGTVKSQLHRGLKKLQRILAKVI